MLITKADLDTRICDLEPEAQNIQTYREFIRESEMQFDMTSQDLDNMSDKFLNDYIGFLDHLWTK